MERSYSMDIANAIRSFMDYKQYKYTFDDEQGVFKADFNVSKDCIIGSVRLYIRVNDDSFASSAICPINAPASRRRDVAIYTTRTNWKLKAGNFEMDYSDGEIRYKVHVNCDGIIPSDEVIGHAVRVPIAMFAKYGQGLANVITGQKTPEEADMDDED